MAMTQLDIWCQLIRVGFSILFSVFNLFLISTENIYQTRETALKQIANTSKFVKNTLLRSFFSILFSVFRGAVKHELDRLSRIYY